MFIKDIDKFRELACTVMTQIISAVASSQYGGQSVDVRHLGKYLRITKEKYRRRYEEEFGGVTRPPHVPLKSFPAAAGALSDPLKPPRQSGRAASRQ